MRRKLAFAMAFTMLLTSVPVNTLTGYAEEAVIVEELSAQDEEAIAIADLPDMEDSSGTIAVPAGTEDDVLPDEILEPESSENVVLEEQPESDAVSEGEAAEQTAAFSIEAIDVMETEPELQNLSEEIAVHDDDELWTDMDQCQFANGNAGDLHTLYAIAYSSSDRALTYEWYDENRELIENASGSSYTFECEKNTTYYCDVKDTVGNTLSFEYEVRVQTLFFESDTTSYGMYYSEGDKVVLQANAAFSTYGSISYEWYDGGMDPADDDPIAVTDTLNLGQFQSSWLIRDYDCLVTDGNDTKYVFFHLYDKSSWHEPDQSKMEYRSNESFDISLGESITMAAEAVADTPSSFKWYFVKNVLKPGEIDQRTEVTGAVTSGNNSSLTLVPSAAGTYFCAANYEADYWTTTYELTFHVYIDSGLVYSGNDDENEIYYGKIGDTVTLTADYYSINNLPLTYQWYRYNNENYDFEWDGEEDQNYTIELIQGAVNASLPIQITEDAYDLYVCYVSDGYNTHQQYYRLKRENTLQVSAENPVRTVTSDASSILKVTAMTSEDRALTYQWYILKEDDGYSEYEEISDATTDSYTVSQITNDSTYQCCVSDGYSTQNVTFFLTLEEVQTAGTALTFADAQELTLDQPANVVIPSAGAAMYFKFTPTQSGEYKIYSSSSNDQDIDPFVTLYDSRYRRLDDADDYDSEYAYDINFVLYYRMRAGQTYYIEAEQYEDSGTYPITITYTENKHEKCLYDGGVLVKAPTCTQEGVICYTCKICGKTYRTQQEALGHSYGSLHEAADATCSQEGIAYRECSRCGKIQTFKRPKAAHTYGAEQNGTLSAEVTKTYKKCQICGAEQILSVMVDAAEQQKIQKAEDAIKNLSSTDSMTNAVTAVKAMDNQALIDVEENNDTGSNTAIAMVNKLETNLLSADNTGITGTITSSTVADANNEGNPLDNANVSGAAVTVASVLMEASGDSSTQQPNSGNSYYAKVLVKDTTTSETASGTYSIDISMNIMEETGNGNQTVFREGVQPAAPILITIPVPSKFWKSEFELLHEGQKVNYTRDYNNQTISFYAASLSPWELNITKCNVHKYVTNTVQSFDATCTSTGKKVSVCSVCQYEKTQLIGKKAHTLSDWIVSAPATCTTDGQKYRYCSSCNTTIETQTIPANGGHNWITVTDAAPTCGTNGSQHEECSVCHTTQNPTAIPATGAHSWVTVTDAAPTCGTNGSQHEECSVCHTTQNPTVIPATGAHNYVNYVVTQAPTALKEGTETGSCSVCGAPHTRSVAKLKATLKLTSNQVPLQLNKSANLKSLVTGLAAGDSIKSWKSDNTAIATVSKSGKVTGKKVGTAKITVTLASGEATAVIKVKVQKKAVTTTKVSVASKKVTLNVGESTTLKPIITPVSSLQTPTYSSSSKKVAVVNSKGKVTAKAAGKTTITIKSGKKSVKVTVIVPAPEVKNIKNVPTKKTLKKGKSFTLKPTLTPKGASAKFSYSTSNKKVAAVSKNGKITAKKKGTAVITITAGKITKRCKITVK